MIPIVSVLPLVLGQGRMLTSPNVGLSTQFPDPVRTAPGVSDAKLTYSTEQGPSNARHNISAPHVIKK